MQIENIAGILKFQGIPRSVAQSTVQALADVEWRASAVAKRHDVTRIRELVDVHQRNALSAGYDRARNYSDAAVMYLTENYEGGEIEFPTIRRRFHPRQGETLVFPAEMLHAVRPVEAGEKQIFLFFIDRN
jgi:predicted 2-oxoglutarate/Fe(II)-dependent dioxygenase YbiX